MCDLFLVELGGSLGYFLSAWMERNRHSQWTCQCGVKGVIHTQRLLKRGCIHDGRTGLAAKDALLETRVEGGISVGVVGYKYSQFLCFSSKRRGSLRTGSGVGPLSEDNDRKRQCGSLLGEMTQTHSLDGKGLLLSFVLVAVV